MKNKNGFTLVELLAVIAILAILVIVAMPNVLGMFNEAKQNTFVTEVQKHMDTAKAQFTGDAFSNAGETIYYSSEDNSTLGTSKLDMDGSKEYFIEMDRHGEFKRVVIYDDNFCYDVYSDDTKGDVSGSKSKKISDIDKSSVVKSDIWESGDDKLNINVSGTQYTVVGCKGDKTVGGETTNVVLEKVTISGVQYDFVPGMTWREWLNSSYNNTSLQPFGDRIAYNDELLRYETYFYNSNFGSIAGSMPVNLDDEVLKNENYYMMTIGITHDDVFEFANGDKYFDSLIVGNRIKYDTEIKVWPN